jgi:hypothetical protein
LSSSDESDLELAENFNAQDYFDDVDDEENGHAEEVAEEVIAVGIDESLDAEELFHDEAFDDEVAGNLEDEEASDDVNDETIYEFLDEEFVGDAVEVVNEHAEVVAAHDCY